MQKKRGRPPKQGTTVGDAAKLMKVSERMVYYVSRLHRSGREDLIAAVQRREMSVQGALRVIDGTKLPDRYEKLVLAWRRCSETEQARFVGALLNADRLDAVAAAALLPVGA
jgi:hypothetical protein